MGQAECKGCVASDPTQDTVKVDLSNTLLATAGDGKSQEVALHDSAADEARREEEEAHARQQAADLEKQEELHKQALREEEERKEAERRLAAQQQDEAERARQEEEVRVQRQSELDAEQRRCEQDAKARQEAEAKSRHEAELSQRKAADHKAADAFVRANGFKAVATAKTSCMKVTYPIHVAVQQNKADAVRALLACGADGRSKNSSGKTALELATKLNKKGSHDAVIAALS